MSEVAKIISIYSVHVILLRIALPAESTGVVTWAVQSNYIMHGCPRHLSGSFGINNKLIILGVYSVDVSWGGTTSGSWRGQFAAPQRLSVSPLPPPAPAPVLICGRADLANLWCPWWQSPGRPFSWPAARWVEQQRWRTSTLSSACPSHAKPDKSTRSQCHLAKRSKVILI